MSVFAGRESSTPQCTPQCKASSKEKPTHPLQVRPRSRPSLGQASTKSRVFASCKPLAHLRTPTSQLVMPPRSDDIAPQMDKVKPRPAFLPCIVCKVESFQLLPASFQVSWDIALLTKTSSTDCQQPGFYTPAFRVPSLTRSSRYRDLHQLPESPSCTEESDSLMITFHLVSLSSSDVLVAQAFSALVGLHSLPSYFELCHWFLCRTQVVPSPDGGLPFRLGPASGPGPLLLIPIQKQHVQKKCFEKFK